MNQKETTRATKKCSRYIYPINVISPICFLWEITMKHLIWEWKFKTNKDSYFTFYNYLFLFKHLTFISWPSPFNNQELNMAWERDGCPKLAGPLIPWHLFGFDSRHQNKAKSVMGAEMSYQIWKLTASSYIHILYVTNSVENFQIQSQFQRAHLIPLLYTSAVYV